MPKPKPINFYSISNKSAIPEILIYGYIGMWDEVDYKSFQNVFRELLNDHSEIIVRIDSGGGSVFEGFAIYDLMRGSDAHITVIVEGIAASMGSIIALGGDTIKMTENARFMAHRVTAGCYGHASQMTAVSDGMVNLEVKLKAVYEDRTTAGKETIDGWFDGSDHWIESERCLELGFVDEVIKPIKKRANNKAMPENLSEQEAWNFYNSVEDEDSNSNQPINNSNPMNKQLLIAAFFAAGLQNQLTAEDSDDKYQEYLNQLVANAKKATDLQAKLDAMNAAKIDTVINKHIRAGTITAGDEAELYRNGLKDNFDLWNTQLNKLSSPTTPLDKIVPPAGAKTTPEDRSGWTFKDYSEKDPQALVAMKTDDPEKFKQLYNANN